MTVRQFCQGISHLESVKLADVENKINLLFAATTDYLKYAVVTALSAAENIRDKDTKLCVHFLYADIVRNISDYERKLTFEAAKHTFDNFGIEFHSYDISEYIPQLEGLNVGMWGKEISFTHYMYHFAVLVLNGIDKVIRLDTDMIVNCDLTDLYSSDMGEALIVMGAPRGAEDMGGDVPNGGFSMINLKKWREENTLYDLLEFGKKLPKNSYCDQYLLYRYFVKEHPSRISYVGKEYNIFPQLSDDLPISDIKILHYTGHKCIKPWSDYSGLQRGGYLWWEYARKTTFYEQLLFKTIDTGLKEEKRKNSKIQKIFSLRNESRRYKVLTILGKKFYFKRFKV